MSNQDTQQPQTTVVPGVDKNISESVMSRIKTFEETGTLHLPKSYSAPNALRIAWLMLQETKTTDKRPVLEACTKESIANSLLRMIILGLNPVKRQCSFVAYGNQLTCQKEYQGTVAIAKRHGVTDVTGCAVFKDDEFEYVIDPVTGNKTVTKHIQTIESIDTGIVKAAYATKKYDDGRVVTEVMSMSQIKKAWMQGPTKGDSPAHRNFPDEMAIKTVKNRLLKPDINSSDDADLDIDDEMDSRDVLTENVKHQISESANKTPLQIAQTEDVPAVITESNDHQELAETPQPIAKAPF
jgi:recombination protein RecT